MYRLNSTKPFSSQHENSFLSQDNNLGHSVWNRVKGAKNPDILYLFHETERKTTSKYWRKDTRLEKCNTRFSITFKLKFKCLGTKPC